MAQYATNLPINVEDLLKTQKVEKQKVEFKKAWHKDKKRKRGTYWQVLHTICAYANDFFNDNGGYIIIGVDENDKEKSSKDSDRQKSQIDYIPFGVPENKLELIQKEIIGAFRAEIKPTYDPILSPQVIESPEGERKHVLVVWAIASEKKPHTCREDDEGNISFYVRQGAETKRANPEQIEELLRQKRNIPFDDRMAICDGGNKMLSGDDIKFSLVEKFLKETQSKLQEHTDKEPLYFYKILQLLKCVRHERIGDKLENVWVPRNVALLLFNPSPHQFFAGAKTEIAIYTHDNETEEKCITGPIDRQIREVLSFVLETTEEEARHEFVAYPERALREAVVNAFLHRGYEDCHREPTKIHIKPDKIEVISYPGPSPVLTKEHFEGGEVPCVPSRNRRIAEFLYSEIQHTNTTR